jgi:hypothetical protein
VILCRTQPAEMAVLSPSCAANLTDRNRRKRVAEGQNNYCFGYSGLGEWRP